MRLTFEIDDNTAEVLHKHLPHGSRKYVYKALIEGLAAKLEEDRAKAVAEILTNFWDIQEYLNKSKQDGRSGN